MTGLAPFDPAVRGLDPTAQHVEPTPRRIRVGCASARAWSPTAAVRS